MMPQPTLGSFIKYFSRLSPIKFKDKTPKPTPINPEITVITGVRRCGKSSLLMRYARELSAAAGWAVFYLDFEDPRLAEIQGSELQQAYEIWRSNLSFTPERIFFAFDERVLWHDVYMIYIIVNLINNSCV